MESKKLGRGYQWIKFLEHWGMTVPAVIACITTRILIFFTNLSGVPWIYLFVASFVFAVFGLRLDCLCQTSSLSERTIFDIRTKVGASAFARILSLGLARLFIRCGPQPLFAIVEATNR